MTRHTLQVINIFIFDKRKQTTTLLARYALITRHALQVTQNVI
jgi:hypothetical protein